MSTPAAIFIFSCMLYSTADIPIAQSHHSHTGRVRGANLPQEYELAKFTQDIEKPHPSWNTSTPACEWKCVTCEDAIHVTEINWSAFAFERLSGTLQWDWLPRTLTACRLWDTQLTGGVKLDTLPPQLSTLILWNNDFTGNLDLEHMPHTLEELAVGSNRFEGSVELTSLPRNLVYLSLRKNKLSGTIDLTRLSEHLNHLNISENRFTGSLNLQHLPCSILELYLYDNCFSGEVLFEGLPVRLNTLRIDDNAELHGVVDRSTLPRSLQNFEYKGTNINLHE